MDANGIPGDAKFPFVVRRRNATATIYRHGRSKAGREYVEYKLATFDAEGRRSFRTFADFDEAVREAEARLDALSRGIAEVVTLAGPDRLDYLAARKMLPSGVSLADAARCWLAREQDTQVVPISVAEAVEAFVASRRMSTRRGSPASSVYVADLEKRLGKLTEKFPADALDSLDGRRIEAWANGLGLTGRNRFNSLRLIRTLMKWAQKRGHLRDGKLPTDSIEIVPGADGEIEIFSPSELASLLHAAKEEFLPYVALGAFAGVRTAEISRLDWSAIRFDRGFVEIGTKLAKTRSRRLVPILPALVAWLGPIKKASGPVVPYANMAKQVVWLARDAGVKWKHNALRHSFISYRLAAIQSVDQCALEAGNSPAMIFKHYREIVTPDEAAAWFGIRPKATGNVIPFTPDDEAATAEATP